MSALMRVAAPIADGKESDTSHKLQQKLERHFGDLITIQPQQGQDIQTLILRVPSQLLKLLVLLHADVSLSFSSKGRNSEK
jgi:hypothetical protein